VPTIYPTHNCFTDMLEWFAEKLRRDPSLGLDGPAFVLVHGLIRAPEDYDTVRAGDLYAHAWIEDATVDPPVVWQSGVLDGERVVYAMPGDQFVELLRPHTSTRYTARDAWRENRRSGNYGPWRPEYRTRCRNAEKG
jgi:hypothetical protein